ncbi:MAG TPA: hypothetical protein VFF21_02485, partial [Flavobacteriaceae bacterium]|nr:hypothetical protein [Flavobacteriaceae bacterium]
MKKTLYLFLVLAAFAFTAEAQQVSNHAIGLRLGDSDGFGPEINYQHALRENNRLELGLAWHSKRYYNAVKLVGIYQWVWNIDGGFNWYAGPGAGLGNVSYDYPKNHTHYDRNSEFYAFITGDVGIEYNFNIPLMISLDIRPQLNLGYHDNINFDVGLGVRY